jgi:hypothetical protein
MERDRRAIEVAMARFDAAVATAIGTIDTAVAPFVCAYADATTVVCGPDYPYNHVGGVVEADTLPVILAAYPTQRAALALDLAPILHTTTDTIALHAAGLSPQPHTVVWIYDIARQPVPRAAANLVWGSEWFHADHIPADPLWTLRMAYEQQPGIQFVSLLHPDGIIASTALHLDDGIAYCHDGWVAPHRRVRGVRGLLLDAQLRYAAEHDCHTVILVADPQQRSAQIALGRGFLHGWGRERWTRRAVLKGAR